MIQALKQLSDYLKQNNLHKTANALRVQLLNQIPQEPSQQLIEAIQNINPNHIQKNVKVPSRKQKKQPRQENTEEIMEGLMNRIAANPNLLNDKQTNKRIHSMMNNKVFQRLVENTQIFQQGSENNEKSIHKLESANSYHDELQFVLPANQMIQKEFKKEIYEQSSEISFVADPVDISQQSLYSNGGFGYKNNSSVSNEDEYANDLDLGYQKYVFKYKDLKLGCKDLAAKFNYPEAAAKKIKNPGYTEKVKKSIQSKSLPNYVKFPREQESEYPRVYNGITYNSMKLKVIYNRQKTGYEETKDFPIIIGQAIAGKYQITEVLGSGVFAKVLKVVDLQTKQNTCLKLISNNKEYFDQGLDEIRILSYIKKNCDPDECNLLQYKSSFYHKQHLFIETELLKQNLLSKYKNNPQFFTLPRLQQLSKQLLLGLQQLHRLNVMHCDLKPQNILIKSENPLKVKIVDLGNASFVHDNVGNYIQSRSYRAPEVILGLLPTAKIDIWSLGCILAQLWTTNILFSGLHVQGMLARMQSILGPWPEWMLEEGSLVDNYYTRQNLIYKQLEDKVEILIPKKTTLKGRLRTDDKHFYEFIRSLVEVDPTMRPSAEQALKHSFITEAHYEQS